jgi:hypothetical protein
MKIYQPSQWPIIFGNCELKVVMIEYIISLSFIEIYTIDFYLFQNNTLNHRS